MYVRTYICIGMRKGSSRIPATNRVENRPEPAENLFEAGIRELPFLMPEPAEKPSLQSYLRERYGSSTQKLVREHERSLHRRICIGSATESI